MQQQPYRSGSRIDQAVAPIEMRIPSFLELCRSYGPNKECLVHDDRRLTYQEVDRQSSLLARQLLSAGVGKGSRIGMLFGNQLEFLITWLAITRMGAVAVPISTLSTSAEIRKITKHADLRLLIATGRYLHHDYVERIGAAFEGIQSAAQPLMLPAAPYLREIWIWGEHVPSWASPIDLSNAPLHDEAFLAKVEKEVHSSDVVSIIYTSGSTADPKGVVHSHGNFMRQVTKLARSYPPYFATDRLFSPMPFFWVGGLVLSLLNVMRVGGTMLVSDRSGKDLLDFLERESVTYISGWPHSLRAMAADPSFPGRKWTSLRGGNLFEALPDHLRPADPSLVGTALGMTESVGPHTIEKRDLPERLRGSFGTATEGMQHRLVDVTTGQVVPDGGTGELHIRGDALMLGMVKRERSEFLDSDGWYPTGDLCSWREGHLFFHGRVDDMIKTAGANVSPRELEAFLAGQPGVAMAFVSGVQDPKRGVVPGAILVPQPGRKLDIEGIRKAATTTLSSYKVPRVYVELAAAKIPLLSSSKQDRKALIRLLQEAYETELIDRGEQRRK